jgi:YNFM family putative membrane transporter
MYTRALFAEDQTALSITPSPPQPPPGAGLARIPLLIVYLGAVVVMAVMYTPQPILPTLSEHFGVSQTRASLLITVTFVPLALAPILFGLMLQRISARRLLLVSLWALAAAQIAIPLAPDFSALLALRVFQGLAIPAVLTGLMTYLGAMTTSMGIRKVMAGYVAATVLGGFLGRALSGWLSTALGWQSAFMIMALATALVAMLFQRLASDPSAGFQRMHWGAVREVLRQPGFFRVYLAIFCFFGAFAAVLNFLPFRLLELEAGLSDTGIGLMYSGYLMGLVVALLAPQLAMRFGIRPIMFLAAILFLFALLLLASASTVVVFAAVFVLCAGMFLVHSLAPGEMNRQADRHRGVVNGLYIAFYYSGGALGSFLPGYLYLGWGWNAFLGTLAIVVAVGGWLLVRGTLDVRPIPGARN